MSLVERLDTKHKEEEEKEEDFDTEYLIHAWDVNFTLLFSNGLGFAFFCLLTTRETFALFSSTASVLFSSLYHYYETEKGQPIRPGVNQKQVDFLLLFDRIFAGINVFYCILQYSKLLLYPEVCFQLLNFLDIPLLFIVVVAFFCLIMSEMPQLFHRLKLGESTVKLDKSELSFYCNWHGFWHFFAFLCLALFSSIECNV
jgi:hypothetical protein